MYLTLMVHTGYLVTGPLATTTNIGYPVTGINKGLSGIYHLPLSILWGCMSRPHTIYR